MAVFLFHVTLSNKAKDEVTSTFKILSCRYGADTNYWQTWQRDLESCNQHISRTWGTYLVNVSYFKICKCMLGTYIGLTQFMNISKQWLWPWSGFYMTLYLNLPAKLFLNPSMDIAISRGQKNEIDLWTWSLVHHISYSSFGHTCRVISNRPMHII